MELTAVETEVLGMDMCTFGCGKISSFIKPKTVLFISCNDADLKRKAAVKLQFKERTTYSNMLISPAFSVTCLKAAFFIDVSPFYLIQLLLLVFSNSSQVSCTLEVRKETAVLI